MNDGSRHRNEKKAFFFEDRTLGGLASEMAAPNNQIKKYSRIELVESRKPCWSKK